MIGDGPERSHAEIMCRDLDICDNVRFLGKLEAVEEVLSVADLFLMPSEKESFGLAALEAMACEVPVISSNTGGIPELNVQGVTGFMSNRGRQNVASYLVNNLQLDWRYGAAYFEQQLIDYDVCSNWGNWAYLAGVGNDPRGNRVFNIEKQEIDYDPKKTYRNLWLNNYLK